MVGKLKGFCIETFFFLISIIGLTFLTATLFAAVIFYLPGDVVPTEKSEGVALNPKANAQPSFFLTKNLPFFYFSVNYKPESFASRYLFPFQWNGTANFCHQFWLTFAKSYGRSARLGKTIQEYLGEYLPVTLIISVTAWLLGTLGGILLGVLIAQPHRVFILSFFESIIIANWIVPSFWVGSLAVVWLSKGGVFPIFPASGLPTNQNGLDYAIGVLWHLCLPIFTESFGYFWFACKITQDQCLSIKQELWWKVLVSKGLNNKNLLKHLVPHLRLQQAFWSAQALIGFVSGTIVVESLFNLPGVGFLLMNSLFSRDYPAIAGLMLFWILWGMTAQLAGRWAIKKTTITNR